MDVIGSIKEFNSSKEDWWLYRERLEQYFEANAIKDLKRRVSILLTLLDKETFEILYNFCYPDLLSHKTYSQLCKLLEHHFCQKISVVQERIRFYSLRQNPEETIGDWQERIKKASKRCKFDKNLNGILVDKFITGLYSSKIIDRICEETFSTHKNFNDWIALVLQFESELNNTSSQTFQNNSVGLTKEQKNYNFISKISNEHQNSIMKPIKAPQNLPNITLLKPQKPYVRITEQPVSSIRFRYVCERRSAGTLLGVSSTPEKKTYPTIEVVGFRGKAVALVSCVTTESPHRPHPYQLAGKIGCKKGICVVDIPADTMSRSFPYLGIQCIKRKDIEAAIKLREENLIDPFKTGFDYQYENINLASVRLCIQVFLESGGKHQIPLSPVVTNPIFDKKNLNDLIIIAMSHCIMTVDGGKNKIILLCEKIVKDDIRIRFYEEIEGHVVWENFGIFSEGDIHKNVALSFRVPKYKDLDITEPVPVHMQLIRPSDGETSEPLPFYYYPLHSELEVLKRKRYNFEEDSSKREYNPDFLQYRNQTQNNFSYQPAPIIEVKDEVKDPMQPYFSPVSYFPPNGNSNLYLQQASSNLPTQSMQQTFANMVSYHNNTQNYNIPMNDNRNPFHINNELEASCHNISIDSSFNNYLNGHQSNDLNNINLSGLPDCNIEQLSDQFLNSLSLDNIPAQ